MWVLLQTAQGETWENGLVLPSKSKAHLCSSEPQLHLLPSLLSFHNIKVSRTLMQRTHILLNPRWNQNLLQGYPNPGPPALTCLVLSSRSWAIISERGTPFSDVFYHSVPLRNNTCYRNVIFYQLLQLG